jgi:hypothetical protein
MSAIDHVMPWLEDGMPLIAPLGRFWVKIGGSAL